jgi:hypothetical protein
MQQITVFIDLQDQLNMFRTKLCPSSGAQDCKLQLVVWLVDFDFIELPTLKMHGHTQIKP